MFTHVDLKGSIVSNDCITVERGFLSSFMHALCCESPNHRLAHFHHEVELPNLIPQSAIPLFGNYQRVYQLLNLKANQILHSRETIQLHGQVKVGDNLTVLTIIRDLYEQQASMNPMGFIDIDVVGKKNQQLVFCCKRVVAVRGGFPRR